MPSALGFIGGGLLSGIGEGLTEQGKAKRERALKRIEQEGADERMAGKEKFERLMADLKHKRAKELKQTPGAPALPTGFQSTDEGGLALRPGYAEGQKILAEAKRDPDGGVTLAQQANNAEIDQARATLDRMGLDKAEILRRTQKATNTGRDNPDYDPGLERIVRAATQRKVGSDPYFNLFHRRYLGPPPEFTEGAGPKALPPGVSAEEPDVFDSIRGFFTGDDASANQPAPQPGSQQATPARPQSLDRFPGRAPSPAPQPQASGGAGSIETMSRDEVMALIYGDRPLSQDEINRLDARLNQLGVGRLEP